MEGDPAAEVSFSSFSAADGRLQICTVAGPCRNASFTIIAETENGIS